MVSGTLSTARHRALLLTSGLALLLAVTLVLVPAPADAAGGLRWKEVPTGSDAQFRGLAPVSKDVAWVSGTEGTVLRTTDGGRHWRDVSPGGDTGDLEFRDIEAWDARHAVVMSIGNGGDSRIYRTRDGGRTWQLGFRNQTQRAFYDCLGFWDRKHGLAMSDPVRGKFRILYTKNGGRSWSLRPRSGMPPALDGEFGFAASGTCLVTVGDQDAWIAGGGEQGARVFHTADRGRTWTVADTPVVHSGAGGIFSLAVRDKDTLVAVGGDFEKPDRRRRTAAYSQDGGLTWTLGADLGGYRSGSAFLPSTASTGSPSMGVIAVGPTGTDVSYDGTSTWERVDRDSLDSVECTRDGGCWGSGADGRVAVLRGIK